MRACKDCVRRVPLVKPQQPLFLQHLTIILFYCRANKSFACTCLITLSAGNTTIIFAKHVLLLPAVEKLRFPGCSRYQSEGCIFKQLASRSLRTLTTRSRFASFSWICLFAGNNLVRCCGVGRETVGCW